MSALARPIVLLLAAALPSIACAAKWERVADTGQAAAYVDRESIHKSGNQVRAAVEWRWRKPAETSESGTPRQYVMERQVQVANCDSRSYAVAEGTRYSDTAGTDPVGSYKNDDATLPFTVAPPRSIRDNVVVFVCNASPTGAKKP